MSRLKRILNTQLIPSRKKRPKAQSTTLQFDYAKILMIFGGPLGILYYFVGYRGTKRKRALSAVVQIRMIVNNNAPLVEGLRTLALDARGGYLSSVLLSLSQEMEQGLTLSEAMRSYPSVFSRSIVAHVQMGEETGQLARCLESIATQLQNQNHESESKRWQYAYICFVLSAQVTIGSFLWVKVFPVFREILGEFNMIGPGWYAVLSFLGGENTGISFREASAGAQYTSLGGSVADRLANNLGITQDVTASNSTITFVVFAIIVLQIYILYRWNRWVRHGMQRVYYMIPVIGRLARMRQQLYIAEALETLIHAGLPLGTALERVSTLGLSEPYRHALVAIQGRLDSGQSVEDAWTHFGGLFSKQFRTALGQGEYIGDIHNACAYLKEMLGRSVKTRHAILVDAMIPMYVGVAGFINLIILSSAYSMLIGISEAMLFDL